MSDLTITTKAAGVGSVGYVVTNTPATFNDGLFTVARMQMPIALTDETQAWLAMRIKAGFANTDTSTRWFSQWYDSPTSHLGLFWLGSAGRFECRRTTGAAPDLVHPAVTFAAGAMLTLIFARTATQIKISVNGAAFTVGANTAIPVLAATTQDIGRNASAAQNWIDSRVSWFATGLGTLTDADAATIHALSETAPDFRTAGLGQTSAAQTQIVWPGNSDDFMTIPTNTVVPVIA